MRAPLPFALIVLLVACADRPSLDPATDGGSAAGQGSGSGGAAGVPGAAGASGTGGPGPSLPAKPDAGPGPMCGAVCLIHCPNGNVLDARGCPLCQCKPACTPVTCKLGCPNGFARDANGCEMCACAPASTACAATDCGPPPPNWPMTCSDGSTITPKCERDAQGKCGLTIPKCPADCAAQKEAAACAKLTHCRWLEPGCSQPKLEAAGCFGKLLVDCQSPGCPAGKSCQKRVINPCPAPAPGAVTCAACGMEITLCL